MKANYKNWIPDALAKGLKGSVIFSYGLAGYGVYKGNKSLVKAAAPLAIISAALTADTVYMQKSFDLDNASSLGVRIIQAVSENVRICDGERLLDVGCGSGALGITIAKNAQDVSLTGVDCFERGYKDYYTRDLWLSNAKAEGIENAEFVYGDARYLPFEDESFDVVVSNYVYHNIPGNRTRYILETLRCLKKGGRFYFHDLFSNAKYGDRSKLMAALKEAGIHEVYFKSTARGNPISVVPGVAMGLRKSGLLYGIK